MTICSTRPINPQLRPPGRDFLPVRDNVMLCRHCRHCKMDAGRRGLCHRCWDCPSIRQLYPMHSNTAKRFGRRLPCRNCGVGQAVRARGLCDPCYKDPEIRASFPLLSDEKDWSRGGRISQPSPKLPAAATDAIPGSEEKISVLTERISNGEALWHPGDLRIDLR